MNRTRHIFASIALCGTGLLCAGCPMDPKQSAGPSQQSVADGGPIVSPISRDELPKLSDLAPNGNADALPTPKKLYELTIYSIAVPVGTVSGNEEFWKRVDENVLDPVTYQTQQLNGVRVGIAPLAELDRLSSYIDDPEARQSSLIAPSATNLDMDVVKGIEQQTLWYFNRRGELEGRTFDFSDNLFYFSFRQPLRKPDHVELTIAPAVRSQRARLEVLPRTGEVREVRTVKPESLYDLGLTVELPLDHCLIVSASPQSRDAVNVGRAFFTRDDPARQMERVLIVEMRQKGVIHEVPIGAAR